MGDNEKKQESGLHILGQIIYYPQTLWGTISVACVVAGITLIVWIIATHPQAAKDVIYPIIVGRANVDKPEPAEGRYLIQFWTPSVRTKEAKDVRAWEKLDSDDKLNEFAEHLLKDHRVRGYRRYETIGQGLGSRRYGTWWVMTVDDAYSLTDFVKAYQNFWNNEEGIYVEVLRSGAGKHLK